MLRRLNSKIHAHHEGEKMASRGPRRLTWSALLEGRNIWTRNAVVGTSVYGERRRKFKGIEHRRWDPTRSKLAAALVRARGNKERLLPQKGDTALYLGAGHGTTISHLHDLMCGENGQEGGRIISVDLSPRCLRDLNHLARMRPGILPVLADARDYSRWGMMMPKKVNWMLQDVSQAGQAAMFLEAAHRCLAPGGIALLSLKAASERWSDEGEKALFDAVEEELEQGGLIVEEILDLHGLQDNHRMFVTRMP